MEFSLVAPVRAVRERPTLSPAELARERAAYEERLQKRRLRAWAAVLLSNDVWDLRNRRRKPTLWRASPPELEAAAEKRWPDMSESERMRLVQIAMRLQRERGPRHMDS